MRGYVGDVGDLAKLEKGLIYSGERGKIAFSVPRSSGGVCVETSNERWSR